MAAHAPHSSASPARFLLPWSGMGDRRGGWPVLRSLLLGLTVTLVAISLRLVLGSEVGRDQIVFSYPAVIVATLLFGVPAGAVAAAVCVGVAWFYVIPPQHSFALQDSAALTTLVVAAFTSTVLVATIGAMRVAVARYQDLAAELETRVQDRTAERNRLWERSPELLVIADGDRILSINPALEGLLPMEGRATTLARLIDPEDAPLLADALRRLEEGAPSAAFETRLRAADGVAWAAWNAVRDGERLYLFGRDTTAERHCGELLDQSRKMEAVGQMTGGLAHDFANLLTPVAMSLEVIRRRHGHEPRTRELLDAAEDATDRARELVRRLLDFARRKSRDPVRLELMPHVEGMRRMLQQSASDRPLAIVAAEFVPAIRADRNALDSALMNLVVNARDASPPGAPITLTAAPGPNGGARLSVADQGAGMDEATLAKARDAFFTTKPRGQGTGLGLAMVQAFMEGLDGTVEIESRPGAGTIVHLSFPPASAA